MDERVRRAAGTRTFWDLMLHPRQICDQFRRSAPKRAAADMRALEAGEARTVTAWAREGKRSRAGCLVLRIRVGSQITWEPYRPKRQPGAVLAPPFDVEGARPSRDMFQLLVLYADGQRWELEIPTIDLPLVRWALINANSGKSVAGEDDDLA